MESHHILSLFLITMVAFQPIAIAESYSTIQIHEEKHSIVRNLESSSTASFLRQVQNEKITRNKPERRKVHPPSPSVNTPHDPAYKPGEILVKFKSGTERKAITQLNSEHRTAILSSHAFHLKRIRVPEGTSVPAMIRKYERSPLVKYAEPNYITHAMMTPNDEFYSFQWHLHSQDEGGINVEPVWDTVTGENTTVAVLDTGIRQGSDLQDTTITTGNDFANEDSNPRDDNGHGTHVAGTIAQSTNNDKGVAGVAFDATLMPVKVMNSTGGGNYSTLIDGVEYAVDNGADIISMSLGGPVNSTALKEAFKNATNEGVTCIAASGNENNPSVAYPAALDEVIAVGATRVDKDRAYYSNYGSSLDLVAPGGQLIDPHTEEGWDQNNDGYPDGVLQQTFNATNDEWGYYFYQGTSMATPHVAGVAALLYSNGTTSPTAIKERLQTTATDLGPSGRDDEFGYGLVNASKALGISGTSDREEQNGGEDGQDGELQISLPPIVWLAIGIGILMIAVILIYKGLKKDKKQELTVQ